MPRGENVGGYTNILREKLIGHALLCPISIDQAAWLMEFGLEESFQGAYDFSTNRFQTWFFIL